MTEPMTPPQPTSVEPSARPMPFSQASMSHQKTRPNYLGIVVFTALILFMGYQQMQIGRLSTELVVISGDMRSGETRGHLEALDAKLQEVNTRLAYLDSKITATDQKAQTALNQIKANEEKADWFGNILRSVGWK